MGLPIAASSPPSILLALANTWTRGQTITPAVNESGLFVSGYSLTGSDTHALLDLSGTWNTSGTPTGIKVNITDTASSGNSLLQDWQVGGMSKVRITKNGYVAFAGIDIGIGYLVNSNISFGVPSTQAETMAIRPSASAISFASAVKIGWTSSTPSAGAFDVSFFRDAPGILAQRNGVNAQVSRVWGTFTDLSNGTWAGIDWQTTPGTPRLRAVAVGTGVAAPLAIDAYAKAGAAVAADIPAGTFALIRDTSGGTTKLVYNNGGTLQSVALA